MNLAVGFFDGVHLGHRRILARADAALTFRNHPSTVLAPERVPALLMTPETRLAAIRSILGNDAARALDFTPALAAEPPDAFVDWLRATYPDLSTIRCGPNWSFGAKGAGDADFLRARGLQVEVEPFAELDGEPISSTRARAAVASGDLDLAARMLGRPWSLEGVLFAGKALGRSLGFPTLNVRPSAGLVRPPKGVYAVRTALGLGVANFGCAPTTGADAWQEPVLEVHLLEAPDAVPSAGSTLSIEMLRFIRSERTFPSLDALTDQIARDIAMVRAFRF